MVQEELFHKCCGTWLWHNVLNKIEVLSNVHEPERAKLFCQGIFNAVDKKQEMNDKISFYYPVHNEIPSIIGEAALAAIVGLDPVNQEILFSSRMEKGGQIFHSEGYSYKRSSCSYFVCFTGNDDVERYGKVQCYLKSNNELFAIIKEFGCLNKNICHTDEIPNPQDPVMLRLFQDGLLGSHFVAVQETNNILKIKCEDIYSRMVFVPLHDIDVRVSGYVSKVLNTYQHN